MKKAAAIGYARETSLQAAREQAVPRVLASGRGREAEQIIAIAKEAGVTVLEDPSLEAILDAAKTGDYIPEWCWETMARILAFVISKEKQ